MQQVLYKTLYVFLLGNMIILEETYLCLTVTQWNGVEMKKSIQLEILLGVCLWQNPDKDYRNCGIFAILNLHCLQAGVTLKRNTYNMEEIEHNIRLYLMLCIISRKTLFTLENEDIKKSIGKVKNSLACEKRDPKDNNKQLRLLKDHPQINATKENPDDEIIDKIAKDHLSSRLAPCTYFSNHHRKHVQRRINELKKSDRGEMAAKKKLE